MRRVVAALALSACRPADPPDPGYVWDLPAHFPVPAVPASNPMTTEKVTLGRFLFYDFKLSIDGRRSCGICHEPAKGFTDGFAVAVGVENVAHDRNTPSTTNVAYRSPLTWRDPDLWSLEEQLLVPLLGDDPIVEMGVGGHEDEVLARLRSQGPYPDLFADAFPDDDDPVTIERIAMAIAAFERTVNTGASPFDQHLLGDDGAMSDGAKRGAERFEALGCGQCHGGLFFDRPIEGDGTVAGASGYFNTGLYDVDGMGGYPPNDQGLVEVTGDPADTGRFRTPSLRNVAATTPYMHDGTTPTLSDVLTDYARGGRLVASGAYPGDGAGNPYKDPRITGFVLSDADRADLLLFFDALTDWASLEDPRFEDPWCADDDPRHDCVPPIDL